MARAEGSDIHNGALGVEQTRWGSSRMKNRLGGKVCHSLTVGRRLISSSLAKDGDLMKESRDVPSGNSTESVNSIDHKSGEAEATSSFVDFLDALAFVSVTG